MPQPWPAALPRAWPREGRGGRALARAGAQHDLHPPSSRHLTWRRRRAAHPGHFARRHTIGRLLDRAARPHSGPAARRRRTATYRSSALLIDLGGGMPLAIRHENVAALTTDPRTRQLETETLELRGITS